MDYEPSAVAINPDASFIAVGGALDNKVRIYYTIYNVTVCLIFANYYCIEELKINSSITI